MSTPKPNNPKANREVSREVNREVSRGDDDGQLGGPKAGGFDGLGTEKRAEPKDDSGS
jgi:hypothetical protein